MAKQFTFKEVSGNGATVNRNKRSIGATGGLVQRAGNQLFASAATTENQHS